MTVALYLFCTSENKTLNQQNYFCKETMTAILRALFSKQNYLIGCVKNLILQGKLCNKAVIQ